MIPYELVSVPQREQVMEIINQDTTKWVGEVTQNI